MKLSIVTIYNILTELAGSAADHEMEIIGSIDDKCKKADRGHNNVNDKYKVKIVLSDTETKHKLRFVFKKKSIELFVTLVENFNLLHHKYCVTLGDLYHDVPGEKRWKRFYVKETRFHAAASEKEGSSQIVPPGAHKAPETPKASEAAEPLISPPKNNDLEILAMKLAMNDPEIQRKAQLSLEKRYNDKMNKVIETAEAKVRAELEERLKPFVESKMCDDWSARIQKKESETSWYKLQRDRMLKHLEDRIIAEEGEKIRQSKKRTIEEEVEKNAEAIRADYIRKLEKEVEAKMKDDIEAKVKLNMLKEKMIVDPDKAVNEEEMQEIEGNVMQLFHKKIKFMGNKK